MENNMESITTVITTARRTALCRVTSGAVSALSPVAYVAFGSGGTDAEGNVLAPRPDQTSLHQEVGRYPVGEAAYPIPTTARYTITIPPDDLAGTNISEAALVDADGVLCAIRNMLPKGKDAGVSFTFTIDDEF